MRRVFTLFAAVAAATLGGCQACDDCTDYSSPVANSGPVYSETPAYTESTPIYTDSGTATSGLSGGTEMPSGAEPEPTVAPQTMNGSGSY